MLVEREKVFHDPPITSSNGSLKYTNDRLHFFYHSPADRAQEGHRFPSGNPHFRDQGYWNPRVPINAQSQTLNHSPEGFIRLRCFFCSSNPMGTSISILTWAAGIRGTFIDLILVKSIHNVPIKGKYALSFNLSSPTSVVVIYPMK